MTSLEAELEIERERERTLRLEAQLRNLADHDPVTDLLNHRSVEHELEDHLAGCTRYGPEGALLMVGLDGLNEIARALGQVEANEVLASVAEVVAERLRGTDVVGRWGADELAILLPRAAQDQAAVVADALVKLVGETTTPRVPAGSLTAAIGVAVVSEGNVTAEHPDPTQLVGTASRAMAMARSQGGGWVTTDLEASA